MKGISIERQASLYLIRPLQRIIRGNNRRMIPILMYHSISEGDPATTNSYYRTDTFPRTFEMQMRFLNENGYSVIGLGDIESAYEDASQIRSVVLTFDDGYMDFYREAYPVINRYGFPATVFLPSGMIGTRGLDGKAHLGWSEIEELLTEGVEFGSHTLTHPQLRDIPPKKVDYEIGRSKEFLENRLATRIEAFSYPYAFPEADRGFIRYLRTVLESHGYRRGVTTRIGCSSRGDDPMFLKRIPVNEYDDLKLFRVKLEGGYDWLYSIQYASKLIRTTRRAGRWRL